MRACCAQRAAARGARSHEQIASLGARPNLVQSNGVAATRKGGAQGGRWKLGAELRNERAAGQRTRLSLAPLLARSPARTLILVQPPPLLMSATNAARALSLSRLSATSGARGPATHRPAGPAQLDRISAELRAPIRRRVAAGGHLKQINGRGLLAPAR